MPLALECADAVASLRDSLLEGAGFELSVPREGKLRLRDCRVDRDGIFSRKGGRLSAKRRKVRALPSATEVCVRDAFQSCRVSYHLAQRGSLVLEDDKAMTEISVVAQEIAASRQRGVLDDEGKLWEKLRLDAERVAAGEEMLRGFLDLVVLHHDGFPSALGLLLARKLAEYSMRAEQLDEIARAAMAGDPGIITAAIADLVAIRTRDPAAENYLRPFLYYKGFHALQWHRISHWLWSDGRRELAHFLQSRVSQVFAVDIHPAVPIGNGVFIDHATGLVVGETAVIGDDVSILHEVTLGGTGKERGDRHPKVRDGVLLCAGAKVLGNVEIGRDAKVGAGSVVLHDVPPRATVAGVPARIVGWSSGSVPALEMDQSLPDYEI